MSMNEFRRLAAKLDQHMQLLAASGVRDAPDIFNRMMGYTPDLHRIWTNTTDAQLMALSNEYPGFYRYALIVENMVEAERQKASRPYDGAPKATPKQKEIMAGLMTMAATLERGYMAYKNGGDPAIFATQVKALDHQHQRWRADVAAFKVTLQADGMDNTSQANVAEVLDRMAHRIQKLADLQTGQAQ